MRARRAVAVIVPAAVIGALAVFVWTHRDQLGAAFRASWTDFVLLMGLTLAGQVANATEYWVLYRANGFRVGFLDNLAAFNAGQLGNYAPLQAGTVYRFHYMKSVHDVRHVRTASTYAQNLVITVAAGGVCGIIGVVGSAAVDQDFSWVMFGVFMGLVGVSTAAAIVPLPEVPWLRGRLRHWWRDFHAGWESIRRQRRVALLVLLLELGRMILMASRLALAFALLDVHASFFVFLVLAPVASISTMVAFTPGALGLREAAIAAAAVAMGVRLPTGLLAASVDRAASIIVTIALGVLGYSRTWPQLRRHRRDRAEDGLEAAAQRPAASSK